MLKNGLTGKWLGPDTWPDKRASLTCEAAEMGRVHGSLMSGLQGKLGGFLNRTEPLARLSDRGSSADEGARPTL